MHTNHHLRGLTEKRLMILHRFYTVCYGSNNVLAKNRGYCCTTFPVTAP